MRIKFNIAMLLLLLCLQGCRDKIWYSVITENCSQQRIFDCKMEGWNQFVIWSGHHAAITTPVPDSIIISWKTIKPGKEKIYEEYEKEYQKYIDEDFKKSKGFDSDAEAMMDLFSAPKEPEGIYDYHKVEVTLKDIVPRKPNGKIEITYMGDEIFKVEFQRDNGGAKDSDMKKQNVVIEDGVLDLSFSEITGKGLAYLENPEEIEVLDLAGTDVTDTELKNLNLYSNLISLNLNYSHITGKGFEGVKLDKLKSLHMEYSTYQDQYLKNLSNFENLNVIFLIRTNISDISGLQNLKKLWHLNLSASPISDMGLKDIAKLENLEELSLLQTNVSDKGVKYLTELKNLRSLRLGDTYISDASVQELSSMPSLIYLELSGTDITDKAIEWIPKFPKLESVNLRGTPISEESLRSLKQQCPDLEISTWKKI